MLTMISLYCIVCYLQSNNRVIDNMIILITPAFPNSLESRV